MDVDLWELSTATVGVRVGEGRKAIISIAPKASTARDLIIGYFILGVLIVLVG